MEVAIIHHHLYPGGVTRIIESQVAALASYYPEVQCKILVGTVPKDYQSVNKNVSIIEIPELNYLEHESMDAQNIEHLKQSMLNQLKRHLNKSFVLHIHNPNLGKNPVFTYVVYQLACEGYYIFNHAHDFAEDRPRNWQFIEQVFSHLSVKNPKSILYPDLKNYKFGILNSFDYQRLLDMSISKDRLHLLPNPVYFDTKLIPSQREQIKKKMIQRLNLDGSKQIITYPVRVIERKNIGEFKLLAALFPHKANWLVTLPPKNPKEVVHYEKWKQFCANHSIPIKFEAGMQVDFEELIIASDTCFTTSIREGFGMVYLEPWLLNTPVKGRNIPYITIDLKNKGIDFPFLYDHILLEDKDFMNLSMNEQQKHIAEININSTLRDKILSNNKHLISIFESVSSTVVERNKTTIKTEFSLNKYGNELYGIYEGFTG